MALNVSVLYRGTLASCNYACGYCPFAKRRDSRATLARDRAELERFVDRVRCLAPVRFRILFTPWGEALIRRHYRDAMTALSHLPNVDKVAAQTNLHAAGSWLERVEHRTFALWCTWHPAEVDGATFLGRCRRLDALGIRYSVGVVGLPGHTAAIEWLREHLAGHVYLWVNAPKSQGVLTAAPDLVAVDPLYPANVLRHPAAGRACRTGETVFSVDGAGVMRRCHFVPDRIGDFYADDWASALRPRACPAATCGCHIGYVHMPHLGLEPVFGDGILERVPALAPADLPMWTRSE